jgi:hypothetical protein
MELKNLVTKYVYRIEPKAGGGFVARATDPAVPPLEAPTRAELIGKIQSAIVTGLATDFPNLKLPIQTNELKFALHVEQKPDGGFTIHSSDPAAAPIEAASHDEVESHFAEKLIGFVGKHFAPELSQALAAQGASGDIKVFVKKTGFTVTTAGRNAAGLSGAELSAPGVGPAANANVAAARATIDGIKINDARFGSANYPVANSPITPGTDRSGTIFRLMLVVLVVLGLIYFFLRHH